MHKLGVIVPYRDRPIQLRSFKDSITQYLNKNKIKYELIVIDQLDRKDFNRGKLLNIGFKKALELKCDYVVFHDVDMLPIFADYSYSKVPVHLIDYLEVPEGTSRTLNYDYFGGVTIFPCNLFTQINGYSNGYKGWGFEDDDLLLRCKENHIRLENEYIGQQGRTDVSAQFNGESSYVAISNPIKSTPSFTMFCTFEIDSVEPSRYLPSDEFSILSFPGFDTALTYTSFHNFNMTFWDMYERSVSLKSKKFPEGSYIAAVRISQLEEKKFTDVSFFINGKLIDRNQYAKNLRKYQDLVMSVPIADNVIDFAVNFVHKTRPNHSKASKFTKKYLEWGAGPRASSYLILAAKAHALINNKPTPDIDDVTAVIKPVLRHRIIPNFNAEAEGMKKDHILEELLSI